MEKIMLKCGHIGFATHNNEHDGLPAGHPNCIIHNCCEVAEKPKLEGRIARCYSTNGYCRSNECSKCAETKSACHCEKPSSFDLAFFEYKPEEEFDKYYCGCIGWD